MKPYNVLRNNIRQKARRSGMTEATMTQVYLQERYLVIIASLEYGKSFILTVRI
jgi:hypothetical protein